MLLVLYLLVFKFGAGFVWGSFAAVAAPPTPPPARLEPLPSARAWAPLPQPGSRCRPRPPRSSGARGVTCVPAPADPGCQR